MARHVQQLNIRPHSTLRPQAYSLGPATLHFEIAAGLSATYMMGGGGGAAAGAGGAGATEAASESIMVRRQLGCVCQPVL